MAFKLCANDPNHGQAIGGNIASSNDHCRACWLKLVEPDLVTVEVVADCLVASVDGRDVGKGGTARLHPGDTNIPLLIAAGVVKVVQPAKPAKAAEKG